jgi:branched-chain amino acid transport system ATP-binding protein
MSVLEVRSCSIRFGGVQAARDVSLTVGEWEIVGIIGPNGAGKTTTFNMVTGFYTPDTGSIWYRGQDVTRLGVDDRAALGMGRTFQNVGLVKDATVRQNLLTAQHLDAGYGLVTGTLGSPASFSVERRLTGGPRTSPSASASRPCSTRRSRGSRTAPSSASRSPPCSPPIPTCSSSTSRRRAWARGGAPARRHAARPAAGVRPLDRHDRAPRPARRAGVRLRLLPQLRRDAGGGAPRDVRNHPEVVTAYLGEDADPAAAALESQLESLVEGS